MLTALEMFSAKGAASIQVRHRTDSPGEPGASPQGKWYSEGSAVGAIQFFLCGYRRVENVKDLNRTFSARDKIYFDTLGRCPGLAMTPRRWRYRHTQLLLKTA